MLPGQSEDKCGEKYSQKNKAIMEKNYYGSSYLTTIMVANFRFNMNQFKSSQDLTNSHKTLPVKTVLGDISNKIPFIPGGTNVMNLKNTEKVSFNFYQANGAEVGVTLVRVSVHEQQQTVLSLQAGNAVSKEKAKQVEASLQKWFPKHDWVEDSL